MSLDEQQSEFRSNDFVKLDVDWGDKGALIWLYDEAKRGFLRHAVVLRREATE